MAMALLSPQQQSPMIEEIKEEHKNEIDEDNSNHPVTERFDPCLPFRRRQRYQNNMDILSLEDNLILSSSPTSDRQDPPLLDDIQKLETLSNNQDTVQLPPRTHHVYQSGLILSQSSSIVLHNQFYIFFNLEEIDGIPEEGTPNLAKIPLEELHETVTVSEAIHSAIQLFNNMFLLQKLNIKLIGDDKQYNLYLSKKDGKKKSSLPSLYPQEKMSKFPKSNLLLVSNEKKNIIREYQRTNNNLVIKEVNESMLSNTSFISAEYGNFSPSKKDSKRQKTKKSQSPEKKQKNQETEKTKVKKPKIIQSTITTKQTKLDTEERDAGEAISTSAQSRCCFSFAFCWRQPKISSRSSQNSIIPEASNVSSNQSHNNNNNNNTNNPPTQSSRKAPAYSTSS